MVFVDGSQEMDFVTLSAFHALSGRCVSIEINSEARVHECRKLINMKLGQEHVEDQLFLCVDGASDATPICVEDCKQLATFSIPHDEKELFLFDMSVILSGKGFVCDDLVEVNNGDEESSLCSSSIMLKDDASSNASASLVPETSQLTELFLISNKVERKTARLKAVIRICEMAVEVMTSGLNRAHAQDRAVEALAVYADAAVDGWTGDGGVMLVDAPWVDEASATVRAMEAQLFDLQLRAERLENYPTLERTREMALLRPLDFLPHVFDTLRAAQISQTEAAALLRHFTCRATSSSGDGEAGELVKRRSLSLDAGQKLRIILGRMIDDTKNSRRHLVVAEELCQSGTKLWEELEAEVGRWASLAVQGPIDSRKLAAAVDAAVAVDQQVEGLLARALDAEDRISCLRQARAVHVKEWRRLIWHQLRSSAAAAVASRGSSADARRRVRELTDQAAARTSEAATAVEALACGAQAIAAEAWRRREAAAALEEGWVAWRRGAAKVCEADGDARRHFAEAWAPWIRACAAPPLAAALLDAPPLDPAPDPDPDLAAGWPGLSGLPQPVGQWAAEAEGWVRDLRSRFGLQPPLAAAAKEVQGEERAEGLEVSLGFGCLSESDLRDCQQSKLSTAVDALPPPPSHSPPPDDNSTSLRAALDDAVVTSAARSVLPPPASVESPAAALRGGEPAPPAQFTVKVGAAEESALERRVRELEAELGRRSQQVESLSQRVQALEEEVRLRDARAASSHRPPPQSPPLGDPPGSLDSNFHPQATPAASVAPAPAEELDAGAATSSPAPAALVEASKSVAEAASDVLAWPSAVATTAAALQQADQPAEAARAAQGADGGLGTAEALETARRLAAEMAQAAAALRSSGPDGGVGVALGRAMGIITFLCHDLDALDSRAAAAQRAAAAPAPATPAMSVAPPSSLALVAVAEAEDESAAAEKDAAAAAALGRCELHMDDAAALLTDAAGRAAAGLWTPARRQAGLVGRAEQLAGRLERLVEALNRLPHVRAAAAAAAARP